MGVPKFDEDDGDDVPVTVDPVSRAAHILRETWKSEYVKAMRSVGRSVSSYEPGPTWDGGTSKFGRITKPVWPPAARYAIDNGLDPVTLVRALFYGTGVRGMPTPNQLTSRYALEKYKTYHDSVLGDLRLTLESQKQSAAALVARWYPHFGSRLAAASFVLMDTGNRLSPLFRYCAAVASGMQDVAAEWHDLAVGQYAGEPSAYESVWGEFLPVELRREVTA